MASFIKFLVDAGVGASGEIKLKKTEAELVGTKHLLPLVQGEKVLTVKRLTEVEKYVGALRSGYVSVGR